MQSLPPVFCIAAVTYFKVELKISLSRFLVGKNNTGETKYMTIQQQFVMVCPLMATSLKWAVGSEIMTPSY